MSMNTALNGFIEEKLLNLHTAMPCKVLSFNGAEATIQPLFLKTTNEGQEQYPVIEGVPVLKHRFKVNGSAPQLYESVYQPGDKVYVVFSERALDHVLGGDVADPEFNRRHSLEDAVIVGLIQ